MKKFLLVLVAVLFVLSGCSKAPADDSTDTNTDPAPVTYKAGMGSVSSFSNSDVEDGEDGSIEHDTTVCALVVDSEGKIVAVTFNTSQIRGSISGEDATVTLTDDLRTKREKKFDYGMNWEDKEAKVETLKNSDGGLAEQLKQNGVRQRQKVSESMMSATTDRMGMRRNATDSIRQAMVFSASVQGKSILCCSMNHNDQSVRGHFVSCGYRLP